MTGAEHVALWEHGMPPKQPVEGREVLDLLWMTLPFIEDAATDPTYKPGVVAALAKRIREALEREAQP